jgi:hypothetical protein
MSSAMVNDIVGAFMLDASESPTAVPNRVREQCSAIDVGECDPSRSQPGTTSLRRRNFGRELNRDANTTELSCFRVGGITGLRRRLGNI